MNVDGTLLFNPKPHVTSIDWGLLKQSLPRTVEELELVLITHWMPINAETWEATVTKEIQQLLQREDDLDVVVQLVKPTS